MAAVTSAGRASGVEPLQLGAESHAAAALFERHSTIVFRYCSSRLSRREDAEDAVQTTFLHAVRSLRRGVVPLVESAWLLGIARNVCLSRWEASGRRSRVEAVCDPHELGRSAAAPQGRREELIGLEDALARLPEQQRRAVLLRDWRGLSYDEVAAQLGVSRAAVETLIFRGRDRLAQLLREEPSTIRRRLGSLGNLGAVVNGVKTAFTGGAAATKVATAVTVVAVSGAGIAVEPLLGGRASAPTRPDVDRPVAVQRTAAAAVAPLHARSEPARVVPAPSAAPRARTAEVAPAARRTAPLPVAAVEAPATAAAPVAAVPEGSPVLTPAASGPAPKPAQSPPATPLVQTPPAPELLPAVTTVVDDVVTTVVPDLPAVPLPEVAELPVVGPVTAAAVETAEEAVAPLLPSLPVGPAAVLPDVPLLP